MLTFPSPPFPSHRTPSPCGTFPSTGFKSKKPAPSPSQCQDVTLSLHFQIAYSFQGQLKNPQAKIVGVALHFGTPQTLAAPWHTPMQARSLTLELVSSVGFVEVTKPPLPLYARPPALDVKLPYDFFYPFLPSTSGCEIGVKAGVWIVAVVFGAAMLALTGVCELLC